MACLSADRVSQSLGFLLNNCGFKSLLAKTATFNGKQQQHGGVSPCPPESSSADYQIHYEHGVKSGQTLSGADPPGKVTRLYTAFIL